VSACFSSDMSMLSVFTEDNSDSSAGVRFLTVSILTRAVHISDDRYEKILKFVLFTLLT